jgi:hypothetical protein
MTRRKIETAEDVSAFVAERADMTRLLAVDVPDCWVGAGFIRNAVWAPAKLRATE